MWGYFFGTTISYKFYNISKIMTMFFLITKNVILKKHFKIKRLFWHLVSPDCKDALNANCQTLAFLMDISLKHCFSRIIYDDLNLTDLKTLPKGAPLIFLVCQQKLYYLRFHEKTSSMFYKANHSQQRRKKSGKRISDDTSLDSLLFFTSGVVEDCGLLSGNYLAVSILFEISKSGSLTFSMELRFSNICKVSLWLSFELLFVVPQHLLFLFHSSLF